MRAALRTQRLEVRVVAWYNRVYPLEPQAKLAQFAAEDVHVTGEMVNGTIQIQSIALKGK